MKTVETVLHYTKSQVNKTLNEAYKRTDEVKESHKRAFIEFFASFVFIFLSLTPTALKTEGSLGDFWSVMFNINIMYILYMTTLLTASFVIYRRFSIHGTPIPAVRGMAIGTMDHKVGLHYIFWQFAGGFLAAFSVYYMADAAGTFIVANEATGQLGSVLGSPTPVIKGWFVNYNSRIYLNDQYWFYAFSSLMLVAMVLYVTVMNNYIVTVSKNGRQLMIYRWMLIFSFYLMSYKWGSISLNPVRIIVSSVVANIYGGGNSIPYTSTLLVVLTFTYAGMIFYAKSKNIDKTKIKFRNETITVERFIELKGEK